jgi:hypothetical protein
MRIAGTNRAVADLLEPCSPEVQKLALATRAFVLQLIPKAMEMVDTKSKVIGFGFGSGYKDMICSLIARRNLGDTGNRLGCRITRSPKVAGRQRQSSPPREAESRVGLEKSRAASDPQSWPSAMGEQAEARERQAMKVPSLRNTPVVQPRSDSRQRLLT